MTKQCLQACHDPDHHQPRRKLRDAFSRWCCPAHTTMAKAARSTRSTANKASTSTKKATPASKVSKAKANPRQKKVKPSSSDADEPEEVEDKSESENDAYREHSDEEDAVSLHSDNLDDDEDEVPKPQKRKRAPTSRNGRLKSGAKRSPHTAPAKKTKKRKVTGEDSDGPEEIELEDGQEIVGVVVQAPKSGRGVYLGTWNNTVQ